jgi:hypothetical protein
MRERRGQQANLILASAVRLEAQVINNFDVEQHRACDGEAMAQARGRYVQEREELSVNRKLLAIAGAPFRQKPRSHSVVKTCPDLRMITPGRRG